ncbi:MAG: hypothetical protein ABSC49_03260 [Candidatus Microgenomates bacterium]|jgi:hypothetical protein
MAKRKVIRKVKKSAKVSRVRKIATTKVDNKLSILLIILALLIFALAALSMTKGTGSQSMGQNQVQIKVSPSPTAKPVVKTVKTAK